MMPIVSVHLEYVDTTLWHDIAKFGAWAAKEGEWVDISAHAVKFESDSLGGACASPVRVEASGQAAVRRLAELVAVLDEDVRILTVTLSQISLESLHEATKLVATTAQIGGLNLPPVSLSVGCVAWNHDVDAVLADEVEITVTSAALGTHFMSDIGRLIEAAWPTKQADRERAVDGELEAVASVGVTKQKRPRNTSYAGAFPAVVERPPPTDEPRDATADADSPCSSKWTDVALKRVDGNGDVQAIRLFIRADDDPDDPDVRPWILVDAKDAGWLNPSGYRSTEVGIRGWRIVIAAAEVLSGFPDELRLDGPKHFKVGDTWDLRAPGSVLKARFSVQTVEHGLRSDVMMNREGYLADLARIMHDFHASTSAIAGLRRRSPPSPYHQYVSVGESRRFAPRRLSRAFAALTSRHSCIMRARH